MSIEKALINLKIIGCVKPHEKLRRQGDGFVAIENATLIGSIKRYLFSDGRQTTIREIDNVLIHVQEKVEDLSESKYWDAKDSDKHNQLVTLFTEISHHLQMACKGIQNLKMTYHMDAVILSELDMLLSKSLASITRLDKYLQNCSGWLSSVQNASSVPNVSAGTTNPPRASSHQSSKKP